MTTWISVEIGAENPPPHDDLALNKGGVSVVSAQILQIFACGAMKIAYKMRTESTKIPKFSRLRRASCAAGDFFQFQDVTTEILPYKIGPPQADFFCSFRALQWRFYLTK